MTIIAKSVSQYKAFAYIYHGAEGLGLFWLQTGLDIIFISNLGEIEFAKFPPIRQKFTSLTYLLMTQHVA